MSYFIEIQSIFMKVCKAGIDKAMNPVFCEAKLYKGKIANKVIFYLYDFLNNKHYEKHVCLTDNEYDVIDDNFAYFCKFSEKYAEIA